MAVAKRRSVDVDELVIAQRAIRSAGESAARWWRELVTAADMAVTSQSLDTLFRDSMTAMGRALGVDTVALLLANEPGDELVARAAIGLGEEVTLDLGIHSGEGMAGTVLATRQPLVVSDLSTITVVSPVLRDSGLRSVVAVPLLSEGHPLGVLYAGSYELDRFDAGDAELLQLVADRLVIALDRVRLFETERTARMEAEQMAERLSRIQRATARLATAGTVGEAAAVLAESLVSNIEVGGPCWAGVWLPQEDRLELVSSSTNTSSGSSPAVPAPVPLHEDLPLAAAFRERRPSYLEGGAEEDDRLPWPPGADAGGVAILPITLRQDCLGVVAVAYRQRHEFEPIEQGFLAGVVGQGAQALDRAQSSAQQVQAAEVSSFFARAAKVLAEAEDLAETLDRLAALALPALGDICLIDVISEDGRLSRMVAKHRDPSLQGLVERLHFDYPPDPAGPHPAVEVIHTGNTRWSDHMSDEFLRATTRDEEHFALTKALGFRSYLAVPLVSDGAVLGSVTLISATRPFRTADVTFAEQLADHVAAVVDNARRYDLAFRTSHILQSSLLPQRLPTVPGLTVETRYLAATHGLEVGGDFFDMILLPSGAVGFTVGDVAGHDRDAAAMMGHLRSATRALAGQANGPSELVSLLQWSWDLLGFERLATGLFGQLDPRTGEMAMASAGHYPPLLLENGAARYLPVVPGPPLGVEGGRKRPAWQGTLRDDQTLLLFTDGVIEERRAGCERSMAQLAEVVADGVGEPAAVCERVVRNLHPDRVDDVALMALRLGS